MKKLEVANIVYAPVGESQNFSVDIQNEKIDEEILAESIEGEVTVTKLENMLLADFDLEAKVSLGCDRCLASFVLDLGLSFKQEYMLSPSSEDSVETLHVSKQNEVDVKDSILQEIISSIPVKKLCRADCEGICSSCGEDLNVKKCKCKV